MGWQEAHHTWAKDRKLRERVGKAEDRSSGEIEVLLPYPWREHLLFHNQVLKLSEASHAESIQHELTSHLHEFLWGNGHAIAGTGMNAAWQVWEGRVSRMAREDERRRERQTDLRWDERLVPRPLSGKAQGL